MYLLDGGGTHPPMGIISKKGPVLSPTSVPSVNEVRGQRGIPFHPQTVASWERGPP